MNSKPKVIATGLSGLVGERFQALFHDKYDFTNLDLTTGIDVTDKAAVKKSLGESRGETVLHLAAFTNVNEASKQSRDKQGSCYKVNVQATNYVAQYCNAYNKYLIHVSTDLIFNGQKDTPYSESDSPNPIEWYGWTKLFSENEVKQKAGKYTILRLAYPFRAHHPTRTDFVRNIIEKQKQNALPPAFDDHTITPTFIDDIAKGFDLIIKNRPDNQTYHLVGSSWHTYYEIANLVKDTFNLKGKIRKGSLKKFQKTSKRLYQPTLKISNQKLANDFGFKPHTLKEALKVLKKQMK